MMYTEQYGELYISYQFLNSNLWPYNSYGTWFDNTIISEKHKREANDKNTDITVYWPWLEYCFFILKFVYSPSIYTLLISLLKNGIGRTLTWKIHLSTFSPMTSCVQQQRLYKMILYKFSVVVIWSIEWAISHRGSVA